jgi:hypothetical protein
MSYQQNIQRVASAWLLFDECENCGKAYYPCDLLGECSECKGRVMVAIPALSEPFEGLEFDVPELTEADIVHDAVAA